MSFATDPILWLTAVAAGFFAADAALHTLCEGGQCGAARTAATTGLTLAVLVSSGFLLLDAFGRYLQSSSKALAAVIAALPAAHLLAQGHGGDASLRAALDEALAVQGDLELQLAAFEAELEQQRSAFRRPVARQSAASREVAEALGTTRIEPQVPELEAQEPAEEGTALPPLRAAEEVEVVETAIDPRVEEVLARDRAEERRRQQALLTVGPRIAAAGPVLRMRPVTELSPELEAVVGRLELSDAQRRALLRDPEVQTCLSTRLAERGPLMVMSHRVNTERLAEYLAPCLEE